MTLSTPSLKSILCLTLELINYTLATLTFQSVSQDPEFYWYKIPWVVHQFSKTAEVSKAACEGLPYPSYLLVL